MAACNLNRQHPPRYIHEARQNAMAPQRADQGDPLLSVLVQLRAHAGLSARVLSMDALQRAGVTRRAGRACAVLEQEG